MNECFIESMYVWNYHLFMHLIMCAYFYLFITQLINLISTKDWLCFELRRTGCTPTLVGTRSVVVSDVNRAKHLRKPSICFERERYDVIRDKILQIVAVALQVLQFSSTKRFKKQGHSGFDKFVPNHCFHNLKTRFVVVEG